MVGVVVGILLGNVINKKSYKTTKKSSKKLRNHLFDTLLLILHLATEQYRIFKQHAILKIING